MPDRNVTALQAGGAFGWQWQLLDNWMKYYYTYVLELSNHDLYIGSCSDVKSRLQDHVKGRVTATKKFRPLRLVYFEGCLSKTNAIKRENQLKTGFGRGYLRRRIYGKPR